MTSDASLVISTSPDDVTRAGTMPDMMSEIVSGSIRRSSSKLKMTLRGLMLSTPDLIGYSLPLLIGEREVKVVP